MTGTVCSEDSHAAVLEPAAADAVAVMFARCGMCVWGRVAIRYSRI